MQLLLFAYAVGVDCLCCVFDLLDNLVADVAYGVFYGLRVKFFGVIAELCLLGGVVDRDVLDAVEFSQTAFDAGRTGRTGHATDR